MQIETHALWGETATPEAPATYTSYLLDTMPANPAVKRPAVIVCGGGAFKLIAPHEQEPVAMAFLNKGYQAFVLNYVTQETGDVSYPHPEIDLAKMVATVRQNAEAWHIDPSKVVVVGFSAGGHICASLAVRWKEREFAAGAGARVEDIRPDAVVLGYPALDFRVARDEKTRDPRIDLRVPKTGGKTGRDLINEHLAMVAGGEATEERLIDICPTTHVGRQVPPVFAWGTADDATCPVWQLYDFGSALAKNRVPHEIHVFDEGGHGLSMANENTEDQNAEKQVSVRPWFELACAFLGRHLG